MRRIHSTSVRGGARTRRLSDEVRIIIPGTSPAGKPTRLRTGQTTNVPPRHQTLHRARSLLLLFAAVPARLAEPSRAGCGLSALTNVPTYNTYERIPHSRGNLAAIRSARFPARLCESGCKMLGSVRQNGSPLGSARVRPAERRFDHGGGVTTTNNVKISPSFHNWLCHYRRNVSNWNSSMSSYAWRTTGSNRRLRDMREGLSSEYPGRLFPLRTTRDQSELPGTER